MDGQADSAPVSTDDLAAFLLDNPSADSEGAEANKAVEPTDDDPPEEQDTDDAETDDADPDEADDESAEAPPDPTSQRKFKVTVKGEDGADIETEVEEKELIAGYQRHADYTRKTQELARREEQAVEVVKTEVVKAQNHFIEQSRLAHAAVLQLAGLKSPEEMAALARSDPALYVAEQARANQVQAVIQGLQNQMQQAQFAQQQHQQAELQKQFARAWGVLGQKGIDKPKLQRIFENVSKDYGIPEERFATLSDPNLVLLMADAVAYRDLIRKKAEVTKKTENAPRLPSKQPVPRGTEASQKRVSRLRSGKASRSDLAAFIAQHNL